MGCGTSLSADQIAKDEKRNRIVQQLFTELQGDIDCDSIYRGEVWASLKYSEENQLVLMNLLRGCGLLSRDGRSYSCDSYIVIELKYNDEQAEVQGGSTAHKVTLNTDNNEFPGTQSKPAGRRAVTRSHSFQHGYDHVSKHFSLKDYGQLSTSHYDLLVEHQFDDDDVEDTEKTTEESVNKLLLKHEVSMNARSKTVWRTQNPEFNELFLFHVPKNKITSAYLAATVMDRQLIGEDVCIGNFAIPLGSLSITGIKSIPPQVFTIRKTRPKADNSTQDTEVDHERQQKIIRSQEFREAMLAHNSLRGIVLSKGLQSTHKTKVYRLTSVKHQQHARIVT